MSEPPISRFPVPALDDLPDDVRARIGEVQEQAGFIPNVYLVLAHRPEEFRAFFAYYDALMLKAGGLSKAEREMIVVATSAINDCHYCLTTHGALLRVYSKNPLLGDQVAHNYRAADLSARERAICDFAVLIASDSARCSEEDFATLRGHGLSEEEIWDVGAISALFALSNRMANLTAMRPNPEFLALARTPRTSRDSAAGSPVKAGGPPVRPGLAAP